MEEIRSQDLTISAENGQILVTPKSLISDLIRQQIKSNKPILLKALNESDLLSQTIGEACIGLSITHDQLRAELEAGVDIPDLQSGELSVEVLRLVAEDLHRVSQ